MTLKNKKQKIQHDNEKNHEPEYKVQQVYIYILKLLFLLFAECSQTKVMNVTNVSGHGVALRSGHVRSQAVPLLDPRGRGLPTDPLEGSGPRVPHLDVAPRVAEGPPFI